MNTKSEKHIAIGIDIGGTKIKAGLVNENGELIGKALSIPTQATEPKERIVESLFDLVQKVISDYDYVDIAGIGLGVTGPLDTVTGTILNCNNLPTLHNFPLRETIKRLFRLPTYMDNDANAMILGEALWGAGKNDETVLGITLGTGLGCALIKDKKIWSGATACAGEIWTAPYKEGIIEDYVSGTAITRLYKSYTGNTLSASIIANMARHGDKDAIKCWRDFTDALSFTLSWITNLIDPDIIVLGGSVVRSADLFQKEVDNSFRKYLCSPTASHVKLTTATLGDDAGFIGAAALVFTES